ncbi:MAG: ABC-type capsular polysaccharide export system permease component KpsM [Idiomarinaceae bacterium HL-53]|nr:MAG: ABC-type capsular polysaccharide export system permease component KpsM [Idiomarinaceae bacterium HL-53]
MREAMGRITQDRLGPVWLFLEPVLYLTIMVGVRSLLGRTGRMIPGADFIPWLIIGLLTFMLFRNNMNRGMSAVNANRGLFAYRQVHPVDTVFVRCFLETLLQSIVFIIFLSVFIFLGFEALIPADPLGGVYVWLSTALLGFGIAMVLSVAVSVVQESQKFISLMTFPLFMLSGAIFPIQAFPLSVREYLMYNPVLHVVESMRMTIFSTYYSVPGIDLVYAQKFAICLILLGLLLQMRFKIAMIAK